MLSFEHVSKFVLSDISLHIPAGVVVGVIGVSGSGKTTLLRLACGLLQCEQGSVRTFLVDPVRYRRQIAPDIRVFFSEVSVFPEDSTILYEFQRLGRIYRMDEDEFKKTYRYLSGLLQFGAYERIQIRQLSLGQRRRAELATVLLGKARLILLDEPTSGLDEQARKVFREQLKRKKESGTSVLLASHNMAETEQLCDRIVLLDGGRLLYYGEEDRLLRKYAPVHELEILFQGRLPDMEDLPLLRYSIAQNRMRIRYHSDIISTAELVSHLMRRTAVVQINIAGPELEDVVLCRKEGMKQ